MTSAAFPAQAIALDPVVGGQRRVFCCHRANRTGAFVPNSLAAVRDCVSAKAPRIEIDVRFLADDGMLVFHDATLDAETTGTGPVSALEVIAARALRYRHDDAELCFLEDVVEAVGGSATVLQVDLKAMRPLSEARLDALAAALAPIRDQVLIGSQAHWNLRPLQAAGHRVALDPTRQWHYAPGRTAPGLDPGRLGLHGLWDDAPLAHIPGVAPLDYVEARVGDLLGLLPAAEWMVDYGTLRHLAALGAPLGHLLAAHDVELTAWTLHDDGPDVTPSLLAELFAVGATTIITHHPRELAAYAAAL